ncbi:hypothetical protein JNW90_26085 [Micromonospora sp. STR1s_5]|nr:hypothetical protein [Micromonospora sp. STR1s_5]
MIIGATILFSALACAALVAVGVATDMALRPYAQTVADALTPTGTLAAMVAVPAILYFAAWRVQRRADAKRYSQDRTIHVEKPAHQFTPLGRALALWPLYAVAIGILAIVFLEGKG